MSHLLDFIAFEEKLVLLQHFAHGSRTYCAERLVGSERDQGDDEFDQYWSWLKGTVGAIALECAIKFRVLCDVTGTVEGIDKIKGLDEASCAGRVLCNISEGEFSPTLRELGNKLIHAVHVIPHWAMAEQDGMSFKYWSGQLELRGTQRGQPWTVLLNVAEWASAMQQFLGRAESAELTTYVGQDWYPKPGIDGA